MTISKTKREEVWNKYNKHCAYCGKTLEYKQMQVDHLIPKRLFSKYDKTKNNLQNLMPSCRRCNHYKRCHNLEDFRKLILTLHQRINEQYINKVAIDYGIINISPFTGKFYFEKYEKE